MTRLNEPFEQSPSSPVEDGLPTSNDFVSQTSGFDERWSPPNNWYLRIHPAPPVVSERRPGPSWLMLVLAAVAIILGVLWYQSTTAAPQRDAERTAPIEQSARGTESLRPTSSARPERAQRMVPNQKREELNDGKKTLLMLFFQSLGRGRSLM
ncbi:MAG: hypothetical protein U0136_10000 [Bdellovibrionota bacterium]